MSTDMDKQNKIHGATWAMLGLCCVSFLIVVVSIATGHTKGFTSALIMLAGSVGILSSRLMSKVVEKRNGHPLPLPFLAINSALTFALVYFSISMFV